MFYRKQDSKFQKNYIESLVLIGNLSNLFSDSNIPYLYYRIAEKIFCNAFHANDLSRGDIALDASKKNIGIGLKTFLENNGKTLQKVAEFNKDRVLYEEKDIATIVHVISMLRNKRIAFAEKVSGVTKSYYHCVVRGKNKFYLYEESMDYIDIENIRNIDKKRNSIWFDDGLHEYTFNISKSTLLKRFYTNPYVKEFDVPVFREPLEAIRKCFDKDKPLFENAAKIIDTVYLPLYGRDKKVSERSGINQWNASGRARNINEIYIPIPAKVHKISPDFFPPRDKPFNLHLPNGDILDVKVCQANNKALMSNPNKDLGQWILRDVLGLEEGELLTYEKLQLIGIDSMRVDKIDNRNFKINFVTSGSFETYLGQYEE